MNSIKRRHFLQAAGTTLATIGLSQLDFFTQANSTHQVLAQPGSRKLALLIGINSYTGGIPQLFGCMSDVEMQYELLRHRYGFNESDIIKLTDDTQEKPTRNNILRAFEEHLIKQAKPGDTVIFHYSGHGALITDPDPYDPANKTNGTIIPIDASYNNRNDIMGKTLFLLSSQIKTDNYTMILDSCHSGGGTRGNHRVRSSTRPNTDDTKANPSSAELKYQEQQRSNLGWDTNTLKTKRSKGTAKGVAIGSAQSSQLAVDASFDGFSAGALSYLLTRYLWQLPSSTDLSKSEPITTTFDRLALITKEVAAASSNPQEPLKDIAPGSPLATAPVYNLPAVRPSAEGVIRKIDRSRKSDPIEFWLGGVSETSLKGFAPGSLFSIIDDQGKPIGELEQTGRSGLVANGKLISGEMPKPGTLLREKLRNLPSNILLKVGLDENLGNDRDAIAAEFKDSSIVKIVPLNQRSTVQRSTVDFIIGRLTEEARTAGKARSVILSQPNDSIGLFTGSYEPVDRSLFGRLGESPKNVADRLRPKLKMFLARQYLAQTVNGNASQLKVDVSVKALATNNTQVLSKSGTRSVVSDAPEAYKISTDPEKPTRMDIILVNQESNPVYVSAIQIGTDGAMTILHPAEWDAPEIASAIQPGKDLVIPLAIVPPAGFFEILIITSASSLRESLKGLQTIANSRGIKKDYIPLDGSTRSTKDSPDSVVNVAQGYVRDLTRGATSIAGLKTRGLDPKKSAIFSTVFQAID
jgi:hypothetical protein